MEFTFESCVYTGTSLLQRVLYTEGKSWLVCQCEEGGPNDVYMVTVKTNGTKTVQSERNNDLFSFELHLIIDFVLTERKLAHSPVKFPERSISHFAMNIIIWLRLTQLPK